MPVTQLNYRCWYREPADATVDAEDIAHYRTFAQAQADTTRDGLDGDLVQVPTACVVRPTCLCGEVAEDEAHFSSRAEAIQDALEADWFYRANTLYCPDCAPTPLHHRRCVPDLDAAVQAVLEDWRRRYEAGEQGYEPDPSHADVVRNALRVATPYLTP